MIAAIFIEPHERHEAMQTYRGRLTDDQIQEIEDAPEGAIVKLTFGIGQPDASITIIEEG